MRKLLLLLMLFSSSLFGQVSQYGKVVEMDEQGNPLAAVTLTVPSEHDCQPTMSDSKGRFRLCFSEHHVGDIIHGITPKKHGYEVVNVHVTRSWTLTTEDTLTIVMAPRRGACTTDWVARGCWMCFGCWKAIGLSMWNHPCSASI